MKLKAEPIQISNMYKPTPKMQFIDFLSGLDMRILVRVQNILQHEFEGSVHSLEQWQTAFRMGGYTMDFEVEDFDGLVPLSPLDAIAAMGEYGEEDPLKESQRTVDFDGVSTGRGPNFSMEPWKL